MKKVLSILIALYSTIILCSCKVNWFTTTIDVPWYNVLLFIIVPCIIVFLIVYKAILSKTYVCRHCGAQFSPKWYQLSVSVHFMGERLIKCPKCNKRSFCKIKK